MGQIRIFNNFKWIIISIEFQCFIEKILMKKILKMFEENNKILLVKIK
jgi:hypothetical protein